MPDEKDKEKELPRGLSEAEIEAKFRQLLDEKADKDPEKLARSLLKLTLKLRGDLQEAGKKAIPKDHVPLLKSEVDLLAAYKAIGTPDDLTKAIGTLDTYKSLGTPDDLTKAATLLGDYKAIGEPKALKEAKEELPKIKGTLAERDREAELAGVEKVTGYNGAVLRRLAPAGAGLSFVPTKEKVKTRSGLEKEVDTFLVKDLGPDGKERTRTLADWEATDEVKPLLPALKPAAVIVTDASRTRDVLPIGGAGLRGNDTRPAPARRAEEQTAAQRPNLAANF